jgi:hypothetical protein
LHEFRIEFNGHNANGAAKQILGKGTSAGTNLHGQTAMLATRGGGYEFESFGAAKKMLT